jgi:hypothetical protein
MAWEIALLDSPIALGSCLSGGWIVSKGRPRVLLGSPHVLYETAC